MTIFVVLILAGKLHTDGEFRTMMDRSDAEFNREVAALDREKAAHDETRRALEAASARSDAAVHAAELVANTLSTAGQRRGHAS